MSQITPMVAYVQRALREKADADNAVAMAKYMKTDMPFYGVNRPGWKPIAARMKTLFKPTDQAEYQAAVLALWMLPHREEKYLALALARQHWRLLTAETVPLIERLICEGSWWDLVDETAIHLMGRVLERDPSQLTTLDRWIENDDIWLRRSAILSQMRAMHDPNRLFRYCLFAANDPSFWMRKAIGWALRDHGAHHPAAVCQFLVENGAHLSALSRKEGARNLIKAGHLSLDWFTAT